MSVEVGVDEIVVEVDVPTIDVTVDVKTPLVEVATSESPPIEIGISDAVVSVAVSNPSVTVDVVDAAVEVILSGPPGKEGTIILNGDGPPASELGWDGYYYLDATANTLYGPKLDGVWPIAMDPLEAVPLYTHSQSVLSKVWSVHHYLGKHPVVVVEDGAGSVIFGTITYIDVNQLTITFTSGVTGHAHCT